jgi:glycosyltransferase involved in cell wall biosynthesis
MELHILGTRGIPASHGGFETFAENLSVYMAAHGHDVTVYCQVGREEAEFCDVWNGVHRVVLAEKDTPGGTIRFDLRSALIAAQHREATVLTLGYNTAIFSLIHRLRGVRHLMNMDGIEWKRQKWSPPVKAWLWLNEWLGANLANHLIADHPKIKQRLQKKVSRDKITVIPYGADAVHEADEAIIRAYRLEPGRYCLVIARPEPENSILEIVEAYLDQPRPYRLVILGRYSPDVIPYHAEITRLTAHPDIDMVGSIHDTAVVRALRFHALAYVHGHQVGGTNPSLVESMAAGNAILAHDNPFNRWVAGPGAKFFGSRNELSEHFTSLMDDSDALKAMQAASSVQCERYFTQEEVLHAYERLLSGLPMEESSWEMPEKLFGEHVGWIEDIGSRL